MVTQSAGPYTAAGMGMALAAYECRNMPQKQMMDYLKRLLYIISCQTYYGKEDESNYSRMYKSS